MTSTHALPIVADEWRVKPRTRATSTAMPTAADTKFCTVSASIWVRWLIVLSPPYACQLVFVTKLTAVFQASAGGTPGSCAGLSGSRPCSRCSAYTTTRLARLIASTTSAYSRHVISCVGEMPRRRYVPRSSGPRMRFAIGDSPA